MSDFIKNNRLFLAFAGAVILMRLVFSWLDMSFLLGRVVDDAFYYFQTARNIVNGLGSTFDGINPTNGYHPLWMIIILPVFYLTKSSPELSIHLVMTLQVVILAFIIFIFGKILYEKFGFPYPVIALAILVWPRFLSQTEYGLEAGLLILALLVAVDYCLDNRIFTSGSHTEKDLMLGALLSVVFLSRLDSVFLFAGIALYLIYGVSENEEKTSFEDRVGVFIKKSTAFSIPVILITSPYLVKNYLRFGHITPISGSLKHSFPVISFHPEYFSLFKEFAFIFFIALIFLTVRLFRKDLIIFLGADREYSSVLTIMALYVALHFLDTIFFMKWAVFRWHFAGYAVFIILVSPLIVNALSNIAEKFLKANKTVFINKIILPLVLVIAFSSQVISIKRSVENKFQYEAYREALWINEHTPEDAVFMVEDAGIVAYFSGRKVVNIDGVINNFELQNYFRNRGILQYIKNKGIRYFAHHAFWKSPGVIDGSYKKYLFRGYSHLYDKPGGDLVFLKTDEIYRSQVYDHFGDKTIFIIWRIDY